MHGHQELEIATAWLHGAPFTRRRTSWRCARRVNGGGRAGFQVRHRLYFESSDQSRKRLMFVKTQGVIGYGTLGCGRAPFRYRTPMVQNSPDPVQGSCRMISIDLAVVLVTLVAAQVPGAPPETPGALAAKQSAAKALTDDLVTRYLVVYDDLAANAGAEGEGDAQDRAQEQAIRAAARKAGLAEAQLEGPSLLIAGVPSAPDVQLIQREAMAVQFDQHIKALEARGEKPPPYLVAQRDALRKPPAGGGSTVAAFEKKYGKAPTRVLERNQQGLVAAQQVVVDRAMAAAGASSGAGGPSPVSLDSCPPSQRSGPTGREWCMGFDSVRGREVKAVASGDARSFSIDCAGRPGGSATVNIEAAWASGKNAADRSQQWQVHGVAKATVVDCSDGRTAEVVSSPARYSLASIGERPQQVARHHESLPSRDLAQQLGRAPPVEGRQRSEQGAGSRGPRPFPRAVGRRQPSCYHRGGRDDPARLVGGTGPRRAAGARAGPAHAARGSPVARRDEAPARVGTKPKERGRSPGPSVTLDWK
jgi:hypothetical protein